MFGYCVIPEKEILIEAFKKSLMGYILEAHYIICIQRVLLKNETQVIIAFPKDETGIALSKGLKSIQSVLRKTGRTDFQVLQEMIRIGKNDGEIIGLELTLKLPEDLEKILPDYSAWFEGAAEVRYEEFI